MVAQKDSWLAARLADSLGFLMETKKVAVWECQMVDWMESKMEPSMVVLWVVVLVVKLVEPKGYWMGSLTECMLD
jgi:F420-0:gamma-glutamyl ligase-like protein